MWMQGVCARLSLALLRQSEASCHAALCAIGFRPGPLVSAGELTVRVVLDAMLSVRVIHRRWCRTRRAGEVFASW